MTRLEFDTLLGDYVKALYAAQAAHDQGTQLRAAEVEDARHKLVDAREALWRAFTTSATPGENP